VSGTVCERGMGYGHEASLPKRMKSISRRLKTGRMLSLTCEIVSSEPVLVELLTRETVSVMIVMPPLKCWMAATSSPRRSSTQMNSIQASSTTSVDLGDDDTSCVSRPIDLL
jgi:hypothetical protein